MATRRERHTTQPTPGSRSRVWARAGGALATVVLLGLLGGLAYLRVWPPLRIVMSPSMEPAVDTGDVAVLQTVSGTPEVGDVVLVPVPQAIQDSHRYPPEVLHRIIEITPDGLVRTQGDNLPDPDPFAVDVSSVQGRMVTAIPGVGSALGFVTSPFGLAWLAAGAVLFGIVPFVASQRDVVYAVEEYGFHLRSHTQILKSMSEASQELAATVVDLRKAIDGPGGPVHPPGVDRAPPPPHGDPDHPGEGAARSGDRPGGMPREVPADDRPVLYDDSLNPLAEPIVTRARRLEPVAGGDPDLIPEDPGAI